MSVGWLGVCVPEPGVESVSRCWVLMLSRSASSVLDGLRPISLPFSSTTSGCGASTFCVPGTGSFSEGS